MGGRAKNGSSLAIPFQKSSLTLRRLPVDCAAGFFEEQVPRNGKNLWQ